MKNKDRQASLDKKKWEKSIEMQEDMSGKMFYCDRCKHRKDNTCTITQERRIAESACARAYNRFANWVS